MIIWLNGAFGVGKSQTAGELNRRLNGSLRYEPDNVGLLLRKQLPKSLNLDNFQDYPEWRQWNYQLLRKIALQGQQTVIVPQSLVEPQYFDEVIGRLRHDQIDVRHYFLTADPETIKKRLKLRGDLHNQFTVKRLQTDVSAIDTVKFAQVIDTSQMTFAEIADFIAKDCSLRIQPAIKNKYAQAAVQFGDSVKNLWR
ncbi:AAA family ATPase [Lapidilactobacillus luobeiensis]|uniref:AAA family ATPase n=1 Tax=Lapidilactobacillus luobeiensis TaxID=2950371 RepID=UPI0021C4444B|nr:AAA family ATPase [Lapidilactobacillus luobeiensis]